MRWLAAVVALHLLVSVIMAATTEIAVTTEESMEGRGTLMYSDRCNVTQQCGFPGSVCDPVKKVCQCRGELTATNHLNLCGKPANVNESCLFNEQCESSLAQTECRDGRCACIYEMIPILKAGALVCTNVPTDTDSGQHVDPAMIGILAGMALMFIIICVVLRLFSKARWRDDRSIFNTPNPRLMNASLLQHKTDQRRGSKASIKGPSRAPSVTSLRPHSPAASHGSKNSRSNSRGSNNSTRELAKSPTKGNPILESVLIENPRA